MFRGLRIGSMVLGAAIVPSVVSPAEATVFSMPGLDCAGVPSRVAYPGGAIEAAERTTVFCTLMRPSPDNGNITSLSIYVTDNSTTEGFSCSALSCASGVSCSGSTVGNTTNSQTGEATLTLSSLAGMTDGEAYVGCIIPAPSANGTRSRIHSFHWND